MKVADKMRSTELEVLYSLLFLSPVGLDDPPIFDQHTSASTKPKLPNRRIAPRTCGGPSWKSHGKHRTWRDTGDDKSG